MKGIKILPLVIFEVFDTPCFFLVDSGSTISLIHERFIPPQHLRPVSIHVVGLNGSSIPITGTVSVVLKRKQQEFGEFIFYTTSTPMKSFDAILGSNWLSHCGMTLDYGKRCLENNNCQIPFKDSRERQTWQLNVVKEEIPDTELVRLAISPAAEGKKLPDEKPDVCPAGVSGVARRASMDWKNNSPRDKNYLRVYVKRRTKLPKSSWGYLEVNIARGSDDSGMGVKSPNQALAIIDSEVIDGSILCGCTLIDLAQTRHWIPYVNHSEDDVDLDKGRAISWCEYVNANEILDSGDVINHQEVPATNSPKPDEFLGQIDKAIAESKCPSGMRPALKKLLLEYRSVLATTPDDPIGYCDLYEPSIPLDTDKPIYTPQYPIPFKMRQAMREHLDYFLRNGIIRFSSSPYNSPTLMVPKKDGGYRWCVDFRKLNTHVITDPHPLPRIDQILEELGSALYLTALDLLSGFYNLKINPADVHKTAFSTPDGHFEFVRLPMGLKNSPSIFQRVMNLVLSGCLGKYSFIYIDDIVIYSQTAEDHLKHIGIILERLRQNGLRVKFSKCQLFRTEIDYLGFIVGNGGIRVNPKKVQAAINFPTPADVKGVQAFLGLVGYFRVFIYNFAEKAQGLYELLKKETKFHWGPEQEKSFNDLRQAFIEAPVLAFPNFAKEFILTTDASGYALGAVLTQEDDLGRERLITCHSRTLKDAETRYSNTDRELAAVYYGVQKNRSYLWGNYFVIRTDHAAIPYLDKNKTSDSSRAMRWFLKLAEYNFRVEHRKGSSITHADALSRYPASQVLRSRPSPSTRNQGKLSTITRSSQNNGTETKLQETELRKTPPITAQIEPQRDLEISKRTHAKVRKTTHAHTDELLAYISPGLQAPTLIPYLNEDRLKVLTAELDLDHYLSQREWKLENGILYYRDRVYIPEPMRVELLRAVHEPPVHGHGGISKMLKILQPHFYWTNMIGDISSFVKSCELCQKYKVAKTRGPLRPTPVPLQVFEEISVDVIGPVPPSAKGSKYILCIQDRLSRYLLFIPMRNTDAETTARKVLTEWFCIFGLPKRIISDRGTNFVSSIFRLMLEMFGVTSRFTTAYRPCANGGNERTHLELHKYLGMYLKSDKKYHWDHLLRLAAWHHNVSFHESLGTSPFTIVTGLKPNLAKLWLSTDEKFPQAVEQYRKYYGVTQSELEDIRDRARQHILKAQATYLSNRLGGRQITFKVGDQILRKDHRATKWSPRYIGPYVIKDIISDSVVKIQDPNSDWTDLVHADYIKVYHEREKNFVRPQHDQPDPQKPHEYLVLDDEDDEDMEESEENQQSRAVDRVERNSPAQPAITVKTQSSDQAETGKENMKKVRFKNILQSARRQLQRAFESKPAIDNKRESRKSILTRSKSEARGIALPGLFNLPDPPDVRRKLV